MDGYTHWVDGENNKQYNWGGAAQDGKVSTCTGEEPHEGKVSTCTGEGKVSTYTGKGKVSTLTKSTSFNPLKPHGISKSYQLDRSISILRDVW